MRQIQGEQRKNTRSSGDPRGQPVEMTKKQALGDFTRWKQFTMAGESDKKFSEFEVHAKIITRSTGHPRGLPVDMTNKQSKGDNTRRKPFTIAK